MPSTWDATSLRMLANDPVVLPTEESRARIRNPSLCGVDVVQQGQRGLLDQFAASRPR